jgi:hypothetical protein
MKTLVPLIGVVALGLSAVAAAHPAPKPASFAGVWDTSMGSFSTMTLKQRKAHITGAFTFKDGRIAGEVSARRLVGYWAQSSSNQQCDKPKLGTRYWGRVVMEQSPDGKTVSGAWGYCGQDPTSSFTAARGHH